MFSYRKYQAGFLMQWNKRLSHDLTEPVVDKVVEAVLYNQQIPFEHTSEYRSLYSYDKLWQQLEHYAPELAKDTWDRYIQAGVSRAFKNFARPKTMKPFKTVSLTEEAALLFQSLKIKRDTSAGLTAYGETKFEAFSTGLDKAIRIIEDGKSPSPCLAGVRTQRKEKTRLVWGYPLEMTILEAVVARPLIDYFKSIDHIMTFGKTSHEVGMRMRSSVSRNRYYASIDYSQFDATVRADIIRYAFAAFQTWFDLEQVVYKNYKLKDLFRLIENYFIKTPIVMPNREYQYPTLVLGKNGGVPSGSYFTQIVDSFANSALIFAYASRFQMSIQERDIYVLGDDCLVFTSQLIDLNKLSGFVGRYGFKCNPAKGGTGLVNQEVEYLGRAWRNGFPIRKYSELVRGALYPEKYRKYSNQSGVRQMEALGVLNSYLLTSYVEDAPIGTDKFGQVCMVSDRYQSGLTKFLMSEGLIPGKVYKRAIY